VKINSRRQQRRRKGPKYNTDKYREPERKEERDRDYFTESEDNADCFVH